MNTFLEAFFLQFYSIFYEAKSMKRRDTQHMKFWIFTGKKKEIRNVRTVRKTIFRGTSRNLEDHGDSISISMDRSVEGEKCAMMM